MPDDFNPEIGVPETLEPGLRRIVANNPSPMTYRGTNTYLLGESEIAVIDPGPASSSHLDAILDAIQPGQKITHIIVTHSHNDHSPLSRPLAQRCGAPVLAFGNATAGRSPVMQALAASSCIAGGEGIDTDFTPDVTVDDRQTIWGDGWSLKALHTPGHIGNHLCLAWKDACFTADTVMAWSSSLVSPPDGDLTDFMASCRRLQEQSWRVFYPGHGPAVTDPAKRLRWLIQHRQTREAEILENLAKAPATARDLAAAIYVETPPALLGAATRNVLAHLIDLAGQNKVIIKGSLTAETKFERR